MAQHQAIYNQLNDWKLIPRPERLTELYFPDHKQLPATYAPGQQQTIRYSIHNIEYRTTTYTAVVTQTDMSNQTQQTLSRQAIVLTHDATTERSTPVTLSDLGKRSQITVTLTYTGIAFGQDNLSPQSQTIHYVLTKEGTDK